ncbi:MAG: hypothetical protein WAX38_01305 [Minisyncoccia bacterium]
MYTRKTFQEARREGNLKLSFVGMSNAGKSTRAKMLRNKGGFLWHHIDEAIQSELHLENMDTMAEWLGYPGSESYEKNSEVYLALEDKYTRESILDTREGSAILDTTGSVVHLPQTTLQLLREHSCVVHLAVSEKSVAELVERYFKVQKPVIWGDSFTAEIGETIEQSLRRSYPQLLATRMHKYERLAHVTLRAERIYSLTVDELLSEIEKKIKN